MKVLLKKEVCGSREQYTRPTGKHCPPLILLVKEVVGPVHSARDPLTDNISVLLNKLKKKRKGKRKRSTRNAYPNAYLVGDLFVLPRFLHVIKSN